MSIYINHCNKVNDIFINVNGTKKITSMWVNKDGNPTKVFSGNKIYDFSNITWSNGTDEQIAAMLDAHYNGEINIHDYWTVGDERTVHLSAMEAEYVGESHVEQDVTMVLMNAGGKTLVEPINGISQCAFIVGQKNCLFDVQNGNFSEAGYINASRYASNTDKGGWNRCSRRTWCNQTYRNALPETFRSLFKLHKNYTGDMTNLRTATNDYFALPSEKEVFGTVEGADSNAEINNKQFVYYSEAIHRDKSIGYWLRSRMNGTSDNYNKFCCVVFSYDNSQKSTACGIDYWNEQLGISPFGCI